MAAHTRHVSCNCVVNCTSCTQTLSEMDFERGIWSAALNGETEKVQNYLDRNCNPNALDTFGYTALVMLLCYSMEK